jgi:uncharacterized protein YgiM (DUF1202 family)
MKKKLEVEATTLDEEIEEQSPSEEETTVPVTVTGVGIVTTTSLRVRSDPASTGTILGFLDGGTRVQIMKQIDEYYEILYKHEAAYVASKFVREV